MRSETKGITMVEFGKVYYDKPENAARRYQDDEELSSQQLTRRYRNPARAMLTATVDRCIAEGSPVYTEMRAALSIKEQAEQFDLDHPIMGTWAL
jgi:hypothetical protein